MKRVVKKHGAKVFAGAAIAAAGFAFFAQAHPVQLFSVPQAEVLFVGDMMFDRYIRLMAERHGSDYILSCASELLRSADAVIGNLEGPITGNASVSMGSEVGAPNNFTFTFPPETAQLLAAHNFLAVNLGNNHIGNFGLSGIAATREYLDKAGVAHFGGLFGAEEPTYRTEINGIQLSFVSYNEFGGADVQTVANTVAAENAGGRVVAVYAHWGDEYVEVPPRVRAAAQAFADAGAVLIIGSHPHVVLDHEYIGSTLVYWSLGNFVFDQYWSMDVTRGLAVKVVLNTSGVVSAEEHAVELKRDGRTCPVVVL